MDLMLLARHFALIITFLTNSPISMLLSLLEVHSVDAQVVASTYAGIMLKLIVPDWPTTNMVLFPNPHVQGHSVIYQL